MIVSINPTNTKAALFTLTMLLQSLFAFTFSIIGPMVIKTFFKTTSETLSAHHMGKVTYSPTPEQEPAISSTDPGFGVSERVVELGWGAYESYVWYMGMMLILEIVISLVKVYQVCQKKQSPGLDHIKDLYNDKRTVIVMLKRFIVYVIKMIFIFSVYHMVYMITFASLYFACSHDNKQQNTLMRQEAVLSNLAARSSEVISLHLQEQDRIQRPERNTRTERMLTSSALYSYFEILESANYQAQISSMIYTAKEDILLFALYSNTNSMCSLLVMNYTTATFPSLEMLVRPLGIISFPFNGTVGPLSDNTYPLSLALSSDDTTVFMTTPSALQIINISNLTSPVSIANLTMSSTEFLYSVTLSPDDRTAFLLIHDTSTGYQIYVMNVTNIAGIESIKSISVLDSSSLPYFNLYTYKQSMFVSVAGQSVWGVYNISDVSNITLQSMLDFRGFDGVQSVGFSGDFETAYVGASFFGFGLVSLVNISGGVISNTIATTSPMSGFDIDFLASIVESPDGRHIFVSGSPTLQIFDISDPTSPITLNLTETPKPSYMALSPDGRKGIFAQEPIGYYAILFLFNVPLNQAVNLQSNVIGTINVPSGPNAIAFSPDSSTLYVSVLDTDYTSSNSSSLLVVNMSNPSNYTMLPSFPVKQPPTQMNISSDGKYLFSLFLISNESGTCRFEIYGISDAQLLSHVEFPCSDSNAQSFAITPDSNTAVIVATADQFITLDISNKKAPLQLNITTFSSKCSSRVAISPDGTTAYLAGSSFNIYDVSNPKSPYLILPPLDLPGPVVSMTISTELAVEVFIVTKSNDNTCSLNVINTVAFIPSSIASFAINDNCGGDSGASVVVSMQQFGQTLFISLESSVIAVDLTVYTAPRLTSVYSSPSSLSNVIGVSPDYSTVFIGTSQGLTMVTLKPEYILYAPDPVFNLGESVFGPLEVLTRNAQGNYDASLCNYKFAEVSFFSASSSYSKSLEAQQYVDTATWANFDYNTGFLTLSLQSTSLVGDYSIYASISNQISSTTFNDIVPTNSSIDLMVALVGLGYIDNEGYLTSRFDPNQPLLLVSEFMGYEVQIRSAMAEYYIEAWTTFSIMPSLLIAPFTNVSDTPGIFLSTPSLETITVNVTLENAQFVSIGYPFSASFPSNNTQVILVGLASFVNNALPQLIIFLNGSESCDGIITVTDGLNPTLIKPLANISWFFNVSTPPTINIDAFQYQLRNTSISPKTGDQFFIQFDSSIFTDRNNQPLTFDLKMQDINFEVPDWLQFKDLTLVGTPPMQLTGRDLQLKIVVNNQYESAHIDFTLSVGLSFEYILKLVATYGGAIITAVGLYVYAATIYNIFAKRVYTYPRDFEIRVGEEVTDKTLFPIAFHRAALRESRLIMSHLDKTIREKYYFCKPDSHNLDHSKLTRMIEETAGEIHRQDKKKLKLKLYYAEGMDADRDLIKQLIINSFMMRLLDLKEEKPTKMAFQQIKREIFSLVEFDVRLENGCCKFFVDKIKLQEKLREHNINTSSLLRENEEEGLNLSGPEGEFSVSRSNELDSFRSPRMRGQRSQRSLERELIHFRANASSQTRSGAKIDLLTDAIEAYAFNSHILDANIIRANIVATQKKTNMRFLKTIRRFLKWDLRPISSDREGAVANGIEYVIKRNVLSFCGTANHTIKDNILVLQIVTRRGRILREFCVKGVEAEPGRKVLREETI